MALTLSKNGILFLLDVQNGTNQNVIVQILNLKGIKNGKHIPCHISDGFRKIKAVISAQREQFTDCKFLLQNPESHNFAIIRIRQHQIIKTNGLIRGVEIQDLQVEGLYPEPIGDPVNYEATELSDEANNFFDPDKIKPKTSHKKPIEVLQKSQKKKPIVLTLDDSVEDITINTLKDSDKISDLYTDLPNWEIVCRITDITYKEFISKKSNKFTQILTIQLMDRTGMKIEGTIFGEYAKELSGKIQLNALYRISKGHIREENYRTNKGPKYSKYNINFTQNSEFKLLHDSSMIPQFDDTQYYSVKQVLSEKDSERQYDLVGILTEVGEERNMTDKNGKPLTKRVIAVSDPQNNQTIEVTLWRDIKLDESLKGKTVLLKNFKISEYNGNITLNSLFKSQIKALQIHRYRQYEDNINADQFKQVSHVQQTYVDPQDAIRSIKRLENEIEYMQHDQTLYSTLHAYVSLISFKGKWFYESCPKCKKGGASSNTTCLNCDAFIEEPIPRFILPIEIADFTGSIWTTAFDEFASTILQGKDINSLKSYDEVKLREQGEKRIFQEFRFRIATKKEQKGVKHTIVGKPYEINVEKTTLDNLLRIMDYE